MEPGGRFTLYSLPDGRTIADLKLEAEPATARYYAAPVRRQLPLADLRF